jgi:hypothetical protein
MAREFKKIVEGKPSMNKIFHKAFKDLVPRYPEIYSEERWDKYREEPETKQEEQENDKTEMSSL